MDDDRLLEHLLEIKQGQAATDTKVSNIEKAVLGNGQPGLMQKVEKLEKRGSYQRGAIAALLGAYGLLDWLAHYLGIMKK